MGELPSQQPPDWWNISGPWAPVRRRRRSAASPVRSTRLGEARGSPGRPVWGDTVTAGSEEAESVGRVGDEQVLRLLVVVEHHLVVLAADSRLLVAAEGRVRRVLVVAVGPHATGLDATTHPVGTRAVAGPHAGAEAVERVVGARERGGLVVEARERD